MTTDDGSETISQAVTWTAKFVDRISEVTDSMNISGELRSLPRALYDSYTLSPTKALCKSSATQSAAAAAQARPSWTQTSSKRVTSTTSYRSRSPTSNLSH